jgi:hypothetical protein
MALAIYQGNIILSAYQTTKEILIFLELALDYQKKMFQEIAKAQARQLLRALLQVSFPATGNRTLQLLGVTAPSSDDTLRSTLRRAILQRGILRIATAITGRPTIDSALRSLISSVSGTSGFKGLHNTAIASALAYCASFSFAYRCIIKSKTILVALI